VLARSLTGEFDPTKYENDYRVQVPDLIAKKAAGEEFELPAATQGEAAKVVDMMAALEASVAAAKEARKRHPTLTGRL
jgi:DNA end-binding protein Ku